jgi:DNA repair exonuclease SbcCD ATPase subunit
MSIFDIERITRHIPKGDGYNSEYANDLSDAADCIKQQATELKALRELNLDLQDQVRLLNAHIASLEYDWDVIKETITTLTHARSFITSKLISMHPDGVALYDENIETLKQLIREGGE